MLRSCVRRGSTPALPRCLIVLVALAALLLPSVAVDCTATARCCAARSGACEEAPPGEAIVSQLGPADCCGEAVDEGDQGLSGSVARWSSSVRTAPLQAATSFGPKTAAWAAPVSPGDPASGVTHRLRPLYTLHASLLI